MVSAPFADRLRASRMPPCPSKHARHTTSTLLQAKRPWAIPRSKRGYPLAQCMNAPGRSDLRSTLPMCSRKRLANTRAPESGPSRRLNRQTTEKSYRNFPIHSRTYLVVPDARQASLDGLCPEVQHFGTRGFASDIRTSAPQAIRLQALTSFNHHRPFKYKPQCTACASRRDVPLAHLLIGPYARRAGSASIAATSGSAKVASSVTPSPATTAR